MARRSVPEHWVFALEVGTGLALYPDAVGAGGHEPDRQVQLTVEH
jgi:hypothetical protein